MAGAWNHQVRVCPDAPPPASYMLPMLPIRTAHCVGHAVRRALGGPLADGGLSSGGGTGSACTSWIPAERLEPESGPLGASDCSAIRAALP